MAAPESQIKLQVSLYFFVTQNNAQVTCHSMFKMFPVISRDIWQQAVYRPSVDIDSVTST
jgi:hypothetical protein